CQYEILGVPISYSHIEHRIRTEQAAYFSCRRVMYQGCVRHAFVLEHAFYEVHGKDIVAQLCERHRNGGKKIIRGGHFHTFVDHRNYQYRSWFGRLELAVVSRGYMNAP